MQNLLVNEVYCKPSVVGIGTTGALRAGTPLESILFGNFRTLILLLN